MGIQHVNLIYDPLIPELSMAQSYVLARLAARADKENMAWPGLALLARETRMTERGVRKVLRELEAKRLITRHKGKSETHYKSLYEMTYAVEYLKKLEQEAPQRQFKAPMPVATNHLSPENEEYLQRLRRDLAKWQEQQTKYIQETGKPHPAYADWIDITKKKIAKVEARQ